MFRLIAAGEDITGQSNHISWESSIDALGAQLSFESLRDLPEGTVVSTVFDKAEDIRGILTTKSAGRYTYSYTALDYACFLKNQAVKQFNGMPASQAIRSLLGEYGVPCRCVEIPTPITRIYRDSLSAILEDILKTAAAEQGTEYAWEMRADTLVIYRPREIRITPRLLLGEGLTVDSSIAELVNRVVAVSGSEKNTALRAIREDPASIAKYGLRQRVEALEDQDLARAGGIAKSLLAEQNRVRYRADITVLALSGGETVRAGRMLNLPELGGWRRIRSASHSLEDGKHKINIGLEW